VSQGGDGGLKTTACAEHKEREVTVSSMARVGRTEALVAKKNGIIAKTVHFDSQMSHFSYLCKNSPVFLNSNLSQGLFHSCVSLA
jgi:hypothetical protein